MFYSYVLNELTVTCIGGGEYSVSVGKGVFGEAGLRAINEFTMSYCNFV